MSTRRFFVLPERIGAGEISFEKEDLNHIRNVLRLKEGDLVEVCNGLDEVFEVELCSIGNKEIHGKILKKIEHEKSNNAHVTLFQAMLKGPKMDFLIQKATEVGVFRIVPTLAERIVFNFQDGKEEKRLVRWQRIALEASKQSRRTTLPFITKPLEWINLSRALSKFDKVLVFWEGERKRPVRDALTCSKPSKKVAVTVGPEGGFSDTEINSIRDAGGITVALGDSILRAETAGLVASAIVLYELSILGTRDA